MTNAPLIHAAAAAASNLSTDLKDCRIALHMTDEHGTPVDFELDATAAAVLQLTLHGALQAVAATAKRPSSIPNSPEGL